MTKEPCPYCGAEFRYHRKNNQYDYWECQTAKSPEGVFYQGFVCIKTQLTVLQKKYASLKRSKCPDVNWDVVKNPEFWKRLKKERKRILKGK